MSTRATYLFCSERYRTRFTVYIHYDGYPEGAAFYVYNMLMNPSKGCLATQFVRANPEAELTKSHEEHGDTDYRYTIEGPAGPEASIAVQKRDYSPAGGDQWRPLSFYATLAAFCEDNRAGLPDFEPFRKLPLSYGTGFDLLNLTMARQRLEAQYSPLAHLRLWVGRYEGSANWQACCRQLAELLAVFPELATDETAAFLRTAEAKSLGS